MTDQPDLFTVRDRFIGEGWTFGWATVPLSEKRVFYAFRDLEVIVCVDENDAFGTVILELLERDYL